MASLLQHHWGGECCGLYPVALWVSVTHRLNVNIAAGMDTILCRAICLYTVQYTIVAPGLYLVSL